MSIGSISLIAMVMPRLKSKAERSSKGRWQASRRLKNGSGAGSPSPLSLHMLKNPIAADALPWLNVAQQLRDRRGDSPRHGTDKSDPPYGYHGAATSRQPLIAT